MIDARYDGFVSLRDFVNLVDGVVAPTLRRNEDAEVEINTAFQVRQAVRSPV